MITQHTKFGDAEWIMARYSIRTFFNYVFNYEHYLPKVTDVVINKVHESVMFPIHNGGDSSRVIINAVSRVNYD